MYRSFSRVVYSLPFAKHKCLRSLEVVPQSLIPQCLVIRGISLSPLIYKEKVSERKSKKTKDTPPQKKETTEETLHVNLLVDTDRTKDELQATGWAAQPIKWTAQLVSAQKVNSLRTICSRNYL